MHVVSFQRYSQGGTVSNIEVLKYRNQLVNVFFSISNDFYELYIKSNDWLLRANWLEKIWLLCNSKLTKPYSVPGKFIYFYLFRYGEVMLYWHCCYTRIESKPFRDPTHIHIRCGQRTSVFLFTPEFHIFPLNTPIIALLRRPEPLEAKMHEIFCICLWYVTRCIPVEQLTACSQ